MEKIDLDEFAKLLEAKNLGYTSREIEFAFIELDKKESSVRSAIIKWLKTGVETDLKADKYTLKGLIRDRNLNFMAAAFTIDWLIRDPKSASASIERGIR